MPTFKTVTTSCQLVCLQNTHDPIELPDGEPLVIGRSPQTRITDPRCSRNQVSLTADWTKREVKVTQVGINNSSVDGRDIGKDSQVCLRPASTLFIVAGAFPHRINFKTSRQGGSPESGVKRKAEETSHSKAKQARSDREPGKDEKPQKVSREKVRDVQQKPEVNAENGESDEDMQEKATKLAQLQAKASREKKTSDSTKSSTSSSSSTLVQTVLKSSPPSSSSSSKPSASSQPAASSEWTSHDQLLVYTSKGVTAHRKIAGFDMDGTVIVTNSGKVFPTDRDDWKIFHPDVFGKMKDLKSKGFKIVFFTNQLGVAKGKTNVDDLKVKIENIVRKLQVPIQVFVATHEGKYRKPNDGMWLKLSHSYNGGKKIDLKESIYVGDAAGRDKDWAPKRKKDFSCSDRLFAINLGVEFYTPEEFFLKQKPTQKFSMPAFDPRKLSSDAEMVPPGTFSKKTREVIVLVGFPACGKSHLATELLEPKGYRIVSRDVLGSWQKCVQKAGELLSAASVVIDNTNLTVEERARYIKLAKETKVPCRCLLMKTSVEHCRHNERFRQLSGGTHAKINEMVFNKMKSSYKEPSTEEGFSEVINVKFVPTFSSPAAEAKYRKFLLEK